jgi:hypothetical protein
MHGIWYNIVGNRAKGEELMYTKETAEHQFSFTHDWFITPELDKEDDLVRIADAIDWVSLSEKLAVFYCPDNGRPALPSRAKVGLLILKHLKGLSDENVVSELKANVYMQYLCDISLKEAAKFMNPSSLTRFRKQIGSKGIKLIEEEVLKTLKKARVIRGRRMVTDTTVMPVNISYPTDIQLLDKIRRKAVALLTQAKDLGVKAYRTYQRTARKIVVTYQKIRKHTIQSRRKTQKKLLQFSRRNVAQLKEAVTEVQSDKAQSASETKEQFVHDAQEFIGVAETMLTQQQQVYLGQKVKDRIVSLHKTHIRPMVRGKYPVEVEFGPKLLLNLRDKYLFLEDVQFNNVSDSQLLEKSLQGYLERFGHVPMQLAADRGFWSKENHQLAEDFGVKKIAIENKGKSNYLKGKPFRERLRRARCAIEAKISLAKRSYRLNRCLYSIHHGEEMWARLGLMAMNLKMAMRYG